MKALKILIAVVLAILYAGAFSQDTTTEKTKKQETEETTNKRPTHSDVIMDKEGKCPKCSRNLSPKEKMKMAMMKIYACPMRPDTADDKSGKCPKCGMTLIKKKNIQTTASYSCSEYSDVVSSKSGTCPKRDKNLNLSRKEKIKIAVMKLNTCSRHSDVSSDKPGKCPD